VPTPEKSATRKLSREAFVGTQSDPFRQRIGSLSVRVRHEVQALLRWYDHPLIWIPGWRLLWERPTRLYTLHTVRRDALTRSPRGTARRPVAEGTLGHEIGGSPLVCASMTLDDLLRNHSERRLVGWPFAPSSSFAFPEAWVVQCGWRPSKCNRRDRQPFHSGLPKTCPSPVL
jgi:hypothetical protein